MVSRAYKLDNQNEAGCFFFEESPNLGYSSWDQQFACGEGFNFGLYPLLEYSESLPLPHHHHHTMTNYIAPHVELNDFEEIADDLGLWDFDQPPPPLIHNNILQDQNPNPPTTTIVQENDINHAMIDHHQENDDVIIIPPPPNGSMYGGSSTNNPPPQQNLDELLLSSNSSSINTDPRRNGTTTRYKSSSLKLEEIKKHFHIPITKAAKELNVGLTVLKKRCRELNITRWPHRKIKSLKCLIHNVRELGLTSEIEMLEEHKRMVETIPEMELTERTKKLRQACFKANYKKRRSLLLHQQATALA
ncbi:hypothetical protein ACP275_06G101300 [Erythranthe tilingii]